ncbi:hypothetical protein ACFWPH_28245 [Nocardia sp. NPDC058499]|uniref:hypothetical protein n=1 Tax=Nocardia sp. NPDC058499 TaxID=3346530 RepID=UPI00364D634F
MTKRLREHVERTQLEQLRPEWSPAQREQHLAELTAEISARITRAAETLYRHNLAESRQVLGCDPSPEQKSGLRNNSRDQAYELALHELYEGYEDPYEDEELDEQSEIGNQIEARWMDRPPMQRWATPWAEDPDEDLFDLAFDLWPDHDMETQIAAAHLLHARRTENLPIPDSPEGPLFDQIHQALLDGMAEEETRRDHLHYSSTA